MMGIISHSPESSFLDDYLYSRAGKSGFLFHKYGEYSTDSSLTNTLLFSQLHFFLRGSIHEAWEICARHGAESSISDSVQTRSLI